MTQHPASFWECDAPGCDGVDTSGQDDEPRGWGFLQFDGRDFDLCDSCINKIRRILNDLDG